MNALQQEKMTQSKALESIDILLDMREDYSFSKAIIQLKRGIIMAHEHHISFQEDMDYITYMLDLINDCLMCRMAERYQIVARK